MFMLTSKHNAAMAEKDRTLNAVTSSHNHWQAEAREWEAKFKKAVADLEPLVSAFQPDVRAVLDVMGDEFSRPASCVAADATEESGISITPKRVSAIRKALHTLGLANFGTLFDEDEPKTKGSGYWLTGNGVRLRRALDDDKRAKRGGGK